MTEVDRWWFRMHAANTDMPFFKQEIEHARAAVAGKQLDDLVPSHGDHPERTRDIRWIYLHMIEEYSLRTLKSQSYSLISAHPLAQERPQPSAPVGAGRACGSWPARLVVAFAGAGRRRHGGTGLPGGRGVSWC